MSQFGALADVADHARNGNSNIDKRRLAQDLRKVAGLIVEDVRDGVKAVQDRKGVPIPSVPSGPTPQPSSDIFATPQLYTQTTRLMLSKIFALLNIQHEIRKINSRLVRFDEDEKRVWLSSVLNDETLASKRGLMNEYITNINKGLSKTVIGREKLPLLEEF